MEYVDGVGNDEVSEISVPDTTWPLIIIII